MRCVIKEAHCNGFSLVFRLYKEIDHLNLKLYFVDILQVFRFEIKKFRILEILNFQPFICDKYQNLMS